MNKLLLLLILAYASTLSLTASGTKRKPESTQNQEHQDKIQCTENDSFPNSINTNPVTIDNQTTLATDMNVINNNVIINQNDSLSEALTAIVAQNTTQNSASSLSNIFGIEYKGGISAIIISYLTEQDKCNLSLVNTQTFYAVLALFPGKLCIDIKKIKANDFPISQELLKYIEDTPKNAANAFFSRLQRIKENNGIKNQLTTLCLKNNAADSIVDNLPTGIVFTSITTLDLSRFLISYTIKPESVAKLLEICPNLQTLILKKNKKITSAIDLLHQNTTLPTITTLNLSDTETTNQLTKKLLIIFINVQSLDLSKNSTATEGILLLPEETTLPTITNLNISMTQATAAAVKKILELCTNLQSLDISSNNNAAQTILSLPQGSILPTITNLNISGTRATPQVIQKILELCTNLQLLNISDNNNSNAAEGILLLPQGTMLPRITTLDVSWNFNITLVAFKKWLQLFQNLESLIVQGITRVDRIIFWADNEATTAQETILPRIRILNLCNTSRSVALLPGQIITKDILERFNTLESLDISRNHNAISTLLQIPNGTTFPTITTLNISETSATNNLIIKILQIFNNLQSLDISNNPNAAEAIVQMPENSSFPTITRLNLSRTQATPAALEKWLRVCPNIQSLNISENGNIVQTIFTLADMIDLSSIRELTMIQGANDAEELSLIKKRMPWCEIIHFYR